MHSPSSPASQTFVSPRRDPGRFTGRDLLLALGLLIAIFAVYFPVHHYPFICMDDSRYVTADPHVLAPMSWSNTAWGFTHTFVLLYDPVTFLGHNLDVQLFGLHAGGHHEMNVTLHALAALLLFWVLKRATGYTGRSLMVAALFALHPVNVENVAWVSELKTILSTVFCFAALGAYRWYALRPRFQRMMVVIFLYGLALLAKPQVITLPFALLLWDYWPLRRMFAGQPEAGNDIAPGTEVVPPAGLWALVREKIPLFAIAFADSVITMYAEHTAQQAQPYSLAIRFGNAAVSYVRYIGHLVWPVNLVYLYPHPGASLSWTAVWLSLLLLTAITALVIVQHRRRYLFVGWFWFVGTMIPMIELVQTDLPALADRYAYVAFVGLYVVLCWGAVQLAARLRLPRFALPAAGLAVLLLLSVATRLQLHYWSDSVVLWTRTLEVTHQNWVAEKVLGELYQQRGNTELALEHSVRGAEEMPSDVGVNIDAAVMEHRTGHLQEAMHYYSQVLERSHDPLIRAQVLANLGHLYSQLGDEAKARECFQESLRPVPPLPRAAINWQGDWWNDLGPYLRNLFSR